MVLRRGASVPVSKRSVPLAAPATAAATAYRPSRQADTADASAHPAAVRRCPAPPPAGIRHATLRRRLARRCRPPHARTADLAAGGAAAVQASRPRPMGSHPLPPPGAAR
eukprot:scaffold6341_cov76-Phaeocystis_antarctica.AAC.4